MCLRVPDPPHGTGMPRPSSRNEPVAECAESEAQSGRRRGACRSVHRGEPARVLGSSRCWLGRHLIPTVGARQAGRPAGSGGRLHLAPDVGAGRSANPRAGPRNALAPHSLAARSDCASARDGATPPACDGGTPGVSASQRRLRAAATVCWRECDNTAGAASQEGNGLQHAGE